MKKKTDKQISQKEAYLKKVNSPIYRKKIKRTVEAITNYNRIVRDNALTKKDIRELADSLIEDIKNPTPKFAVASTPETDDAPTDSIKY